MKYSKLFYCVGVLTVFQMTTIYGQNFPVTPSTPTDFETRNLGNHLTGAATHSEPKVTEKRTVTYTAVSPLRAWKNTKGVTVSGRLLAFEPGNHADSQKPLTLIRKGKVRLLVEKSKKFHDLPLTSLSQSDQEYLKGLIKARLEAAKSPTKK